VEGERHLSTIVVSFFDARAIRLKADATEDFEVV
jgi:hypothetical protein